MAAQTTAAQTIAAQAAAQTAAPVANATDGDPGGATTGNANDIANANGGPDDKIKKSLKAAYAHSVYGSGLHFMAETEGQNRVGINTVWLLLCGTLVMFMQAGFALVETGFTRAKNAVHTMMMNFCIYFISLLGFWAVGYAFMYGAAGGSGVANLGGLAPFWIGS